VEVDVEHVEEQQGSFLVVDMMDIHVSNLLGKLSCHAMA
jgi:hypothetical protein